MAQDSKIEWCDHTINFWHGCSKVSPGCTYCYAETMDARFHPEPRESRGRVGQSAHWGPDAPRLLRLDAARKEALRYERRAMKEGRSFRVFTNSMSDFFEDRRDLDGARLEALDTMRKTSHLTWMILTKRPERIRELLGRCLATASIGMTDLYGWLEPWIGGHPPANVWLGTTVEDQERADLRIPALLQVPAAVRFLSCEPMLGPVDLEYPVSMWPDGPAQCCDGRECGCMGGPIDPPLIYGIDWVICGGESGPHARPMHPDWARSLRDQCAAAGVPFLFKQWGEHAPNWLNDDAGQKIPGSEWVDRMGKKIAGRLLDGVEHNGYPEVRK